MSYSAIWSKLGMPETMAGKTMVDVGCWEGEICIEALQRGADYVLGLDACTSPELATNLAQHPFQFMQLDIFSEKALELPDFDVVYCAGVLYHVENVLSLLFRLKSLMAPGGLLVIETTCLVDDDQVPLMVYHPRDTLDGNPSNWWSPNARCLCDMLDSCGLEQVEVTFRSERTMQTTDETPVEIGRIGVRAIKPAGPVRAVSDKILPRAPILMPTADKGGSRRFRRK